MGGFASHARQKAFNIKKQTPGLTLAPGQGQAAQVGRLQDAPTSHFLPMRSSLFFELCMVLLPDLGAAW